MEILKCEEVVKAVGGTLISGEVNTVFITFHRFEEYKTGRFVYSSYWRKI